MWSTARLGRNWALFFWIWLDIDDLQVETTIFTKFCKIKPNNEFGDFKAPWKWEKKEALRMWWISQNLSDLVKRSINLPFLHGCLVRGHPLIFLKWQFWRDILCTVYLPWPSTSSIEQRIRVASAQEAFTSAEAAQWIGGDLAALEDGERQCRWVVNVMGGCG